MEECLTDDRSAWEGARVNISRGTEQREGDCKIAELSAEAVKGEIERVERLCLVN